MILGNNTTYHSHRGYTLVEIMVVMLISFIVLGGVYKAITTESIEMDKEEIILDMQLNARAALDIIAADIRKAGFQVERVEIYPDSSAVGAKAS